MCCQEHGLRGGDGGLRGPREQGDVEQRRAAIQEVQAGEDEDQEDHGAPDHVHVDHLLQLGSLVSWPPVVQHRLALVAGIDYHPLHVVRVLDDTFSQQQVIFSHRYPLTPGLDQAPMEPVYLGGGRVTF